jgi:hypothetical protein
MLQGGEFVMRKSAVNKYGTGFMESLNNGEPRGYAEGGVVRKGIYDAGFQGKLIHHGKGDDEGVIGEKILGGATAIGANDRARQELAEKMIAEKGMQSKYIEKPRGHSILLANEFLLDDAKKPGMGVLNTDPRLSALALQSDDNPQNAIRDELEQSLHDYFMDHAQHQADYQEQLKKFHEQRKKRARNMMIQAGIQIAGAAVATGLTNIGNNMRANAAKSSMAKIEAGTADKGDYMRAARWSETHGMTAQGQTFRSMGKLSGDFTSGQMAHYTGPGGVTNAYVDAGVVTANNPKGLDTSSLFIDAGSGGAKLQQSFGNAGMKSWVQGAGKADIWGGGKGGWGRLTYDPISKQHLGARTFFGGSKGKQGRQAFRPHQGGSAMPFQGGQTWEPRARGGMMYGGDNVPALLTGGEYVINKDSVGKYGVDFFEQLNANRYRTGGYVGDSSPQTGSNLGGVGESTNNINITVNVDKGNGALTNIESSSDGSSASEEQRSKALAEKVNSAVINTIIEQKRPGGLLYE